MLWTQTLLPALARKDNLDIFWGVTHRLPLFLPAKVTKIVTIHDLVWHKQGQTMRPLSKLMEQVLMPMSLKLADEIITDSESTRTDLKKKFPSLNKDLHVVYPGVTNMKINTETNLLEKFKILGHFFLFVGTLEPRKNLIRLLNAYASVIKNIPNAPKFVIAGEEGWGNLNISEHVQQLGVETHVILTGPVNDQELASLYNGAMFLAMPSLYEGFGLPLIEAMSFGLPILTSNVSSMPEVSREAAILVNPYDQNSIASGLEILINEENRRASLSLQALSISARFTWQQSAKQIWDIMQKAVTKSS